MNYAFLSSQYGQLNEANRAWQEFHRSQVENFRSTIQDCIEFDDDVSFDNLAQQIVDAITKERESLNEQYQALEKAYNEIQSGMLPLCFNISVQYYEKFN